MSFATMMEPTTAQQIAEYQQVWSCFHKEAYGFRPRYDVSDWTLAEWEVEWDRLGAMCEANNAERKERQAVAVAEFEAAIISLIEKGAGDRETAIRWMLEPDAQSPKSYLEYDYDLPHGYLGGKHWE